MPPQITGVSSSSPPPLNEGSNGYGARSKQVLVPPTSITCTDLLLAPRISKISEPEMKDFEDSKFLNNYMVVGVSSIIEFFQWWVEISLNENLILLKNV